MEKAITDALVHREDKWHLVEQEDAARFEMMTNV